MKIIFTLCAVVAVLFLLTRWPAENEFVAVSASTKIQMPIEKAWEKLQDLSVAHHYVPDLERVEMLTEQRTGVGASRRVYQTSGSSLQETVIDWQEGRGFQIELHNATFFTPFDKAYFRYALVAAQGETLFTATMTYRPTYGLLGQWLGGSVLKTYIESNLTVIATSMKHYYETGVPVTDAMRKAWSQQ